MVISSGKILGIESLREIFYGRSKILARELQSAVNSQCDRECSLFLQLLSIFVRLRVVKVFSAFQKNSRKGRIRIISRTELTKPKDCLRKKKKRCMKNRLPQFPGSG